jgi:hypothetical protein
MVRLRIHFRLTAAALAGAVVLSACGSRYISPAAVVDGRRITQDSLKQELHFALSDNQTAQQVQAQGEAGRKDLTRRVLAFLIDLELVQGYASAHHIGVTRQDIEQQLQQAISQAGGQAQFDQALRIRSLTLADVRTNIQRQILFTRVEDAIAQAALGTTTADQQQKDDAFTGWLQARLKAAHIEVNPRFGRLDVAQGQVLPITSTEG